MALKILGPQLTNILDDLREHLPSSCLTYLQILDAVRGSTKIGVWVDKWPNWNVVIVTPDEWSKDAEKSWNIVSSYAIDDSKIEAMLQGTEIFQPETICLTGIPNGLFPQIKSSITKCAGAKQLKFASKSWDCSTFYATEITYEGVLPEGFSIRRLTPEDSIMMASWWLPIPGSAKHIEDCIRITKHTICVLNEQGEPISWAVKHLYGALGFTFTNPKYRKMGLGKFVTATLAREIIQEDGFCVTCVSVENVSSLNLHKSVGYETLSSSSVFSYFTPCTLKADEDSCLHFCNVS